MIWDLLEFFLSLNFKLRSWRSNFSAILGILKFEDLQTYLSYLRTYRLWDFEGDF